jgi:hypothetical protein
LFHAAIYYLCIKILLKASLYILLSMYSVVTLVNVHLTKFTYYVSAARATPPCDGASSVVIRFVNSFEYDY